MNGSRSVIASPLKRLGLNRFRNSFRALALGAALGRERFRGRSYALLGLLCLGFTVMLAVLERSFGSRGAADRVLPGFFGVVIPLWSFAVTSLAIGRRRLSDSVWCFARFGLRRGPLAVGLLLAAGLGAAVVAWVSVILALAITHGLSAPLLSDGWVSGWIAALGAGCYVAWFGLGASFMRRGRGRWIPLLADLIFGGGAGVAAVVWPRAQLRNLIGGLAPLDLPQTSSSALLVGTTIIVLAVASLRCGD